MATEATCITEHAAYITCDGQGIPSAMYVLGPYLAEASAVAAIEAHGAVCTGLGDPEADPPVAPTCYARILTDYRWQNVIIAP